MTSYKIKKMLEINQAIKEKEKALKELKKAFDRYKDEFINENEQNEKLIYSNYVIYYKNVESKRLDSAKLKQEQEKIYQAYLKSSSSIRFYITEN